MTRHARGLLVRLVATALAVVGVGMVPITSAGTAQAAPGDVGYADFKYGPGMGGGFIDPDLSPTASKPQSKLWFAQDRWWGVLQVPNTTTTTIHSYNENTHTWTDTGVVIDNRANPTHADVLWAGGEGKLYVASAGRDGSSSGIRVSRYRFDSATGKYVKEAGLPEGAINNAGVEAAVLAKDSTGRLWVAYTAANANGRRLRLLVSNTAQTSWGPAFTPTVGGAPMEGTDMTTDDIATITNHDGKVSVVWSNQVADAEGNTAIFAAQHPDGSAPEEGWEASQKIFKGPNGGDDHISLTSAEGAPSGKLFVAIKSALDDANPIDAASGLVRVLVLRNNGTWESHVHSRVREDMTRPIILLEPSKGMMHVFATAPVAGGVVYKKSSPMNNVSFPEGMGEPFIKLADHNFVNNPTSTKQNLTDASGILVLASDQKTGHYVHNHVTRVAPTANFTFTPQTGPAPLEVKFTDTSTGSPSSWAWDFGDGTKSTLRNPTHTFTTAGAKTVTLKVSNAVGSDTKTATITVNPPKPVASFTHEPAGGFAPLTVQFTNTSTPTPAPEGTTWAWKFGDGGTSTEPNPQHTFTEPGSFTVELTVKNVSGTSTSTAKIEVAPHPESPVVVLDEPSSAFTAAGSVDAAWHTTTDPAETADYDVQVREIGPGAKAKWKRTNVTDLTETTMQVPARAGSTYCFRVRGTNIAGEVGAWSQQKCTAVPIDDRALRASGKWRDATGAAYYMETALTARARGSQVVRTATGKQVSLLVTRRPAGGKVAVYRGKRLVKRVSLKAGQVKHQRLVKVVSTKRVKTARYRVVVTSRGKPVTIDGFAVSRR